MRTRNRIALVNALKKMTFKDLSTEESEAARSLLQKLETSDSAETPSRKRASKKEGTAKSDKPVLTGEKGKGIVSVTAEEAKTAKTIPAKEEDELAL